MENNKERLLKEALILIKKADYTAEEKKNLRRNIKHFLSIVEYDRTLLDTTWSFFDYRKEYNDEDEGRGLDLNWDWDNAKGVFGFYTDNGHSFSFDFYNDGKSFLFGGEDGDDGFSCGMFVEDLEMFFKDMGIYEQ